MAKPESPLNHDTMVSLKTGARLSKRNYKKVEGLRPAAEAIEFIAAGPNEDKRLRKNLELKNEPRQKKY